MSSTYSSNLRVELIGSGDQAGTWGTTTNNNLAYLLDTAIAGAISVTISGTPQALTAIQGPTSTSAANQAVYATLKLISAPSAFTLYAPPAAKQYIVWNATSYTATIGNATALGGTTSTGGATVTLAAGAKVLIWSDGTNFYKTDINPGTVTSVGFTGGIVSVANPTTTPAFTVAGTQGGVPYFSSSSAWASSAAGTAGQVLTSNGASAPTWQTILPSGTAMLFAQTAAPTGFTKSLTHDNKALRVVTGSASSGGTSAFTTVFTNQTPTITASGLSVGSTTLTTAQMPSHTHNNTTKMTSSVAANFASSIGIAAGVDTGLFGGLDSTGGGGSHNHTISGTATSSAITLDIQYVDVIIATKD
jgi:hypothetical protein